MAVDAMLKLDEDTVITGAGDGYIRVLSIQPHNLLGVLAQQEEGGCDRMSLSPDNSILATVSYDALRVWDTSCLVEGDAEDEEADQGQANQAEVYILYLSAFGSAFNMVSSI